MEPLWGMLSAASRLGAAVGAGVSKAYRRATGRPDPVKLVKTVRPVSAGSGVRTVPTATPLPVPLPVGGYDGATAIMRERAEIRAKIRTLQATPPADDAHRVLLLSEIEYQERLAAENKAQRVRAREEALHIVEVTAPLLKEYREGTPEREEVEEVVAAAEKELRTLENYGVR